MQSEKLKGLPLQLVSYLRGGDWVPKGDLTAIEWKHVRGQNYGKRYLPETVGRALRGLEERSIIAVKACGISVQYKHIPVTGDLRRRYIPTSDRDKGAEGKLFKSV